MDKWITLMGAEDVRSAGNSFRDAAEIIQRASSQISETVDRFRMATDDNLSRLSNMLDLHTRALACHCECLGMNAENSSAVCVDRTPPYGDVQYYRVMEKWGLIDERGNSII